VRQAEAEAVAASASTPPPLLGMVLFLASYFTLRGIAAEWPPPNVELECP
jgi:hypothetical protein